MQSLPSYHQLGDRVSVHFKGVYLGGNVTEVIFTEEGIFYTVYIDQEVLLHHLESSIVLQPETGLTD